MVLLKSLVLPLPLYSLLMSLIVKNFIENFLEQTLLKFPKCYRLKKYSYFILTCGNVQFHLTHLQPLQLKVLYFRLQVFASLLKVHFQILISEPIFCFRFDHVGEIQLSSIVLQLHHQAHRLQIKYLCTIYFCIRSIYLQNPIYVQ